LEARVHKLDSFIETEAGLVSVEAEPSLGSAEKPDPVSIETPA
jgi:hypothetical protein